jgi:hypothetical protein
MAKSSSQAATDIALHQDAPENRPEYYASRRPAIRDTISGARQVTSSDFGKPTGILIGLLAVNFAWTLFRTIVNNPNKVFHTALQALTGLWVVGLGVLIVAQFNPRLAMLFMALITVGNVLGNNAVNNRAISALNGVFVGKVR